MQEPIVISKTKQEINEVISAEIYDRLDGQLTLSFRTKIKRVTSIDYGDELKFRNKRFYVTSVTRSISNGAYYLDVQAHHISMALTDEIRELDGFVFEGPARDALTQILTGTGYTADVETAINKTVKFEHSGKINRRALLNELCAKTGGELDYTELVIGIVAHRGSKTRYDITSKCPVMDFSVTQSEDGTSYELTTDTIYGAQVGDEVRITTDLPVPAAADVRVIGIRYDPFNAKRVVIELGDYRQDIVNEIVDDKEKLKDYVTNEGFEERVEANVDTYLESENGKSSIEHVLSGTYARKDEITGFVTETQVNATIGAYIDSETGIAKIENKLSGTFQSKDDMGQYITQSNINGSIAAYIDTEAGIGKIVSAMSGTYQKKSDMSDYVTTTNLYTSISQYLNTASGQAQIVSAVEGKFVTESDLSGYVKTTNLNTSIGQYIDSSTGKAKVVSAVSGTYQTITGMSDYATTKSVSEIEQSVSDVESSITLSATYSKNTIGTNVYALLQLVSNANSSSIKIKADKIDFTGFTTFLRASDLGSGGSTTIDGGRITTGTISADRIDVSSLKVNTIYGKGSYSSYTAMTTDGTSLYIGGASFSASYSNIYLAAKTKVYFGSTGVFEICVDMSSDSIYSTYAASSCGTSSYPWGEIHGGGTTAYHIVIADTVIRPSASSTYSDYSLGTSLYPWNAVYAKKIYLNGTELTTGGSLAGTAVTMGGSSSYYIQATTNRQLCPNSSLTTYPFYLGTSSYYWHYAYIGSVASYIGSSDSSKLGFFGKTPVARQTVSDSATVATLITALKAYGLIG